MVLAQHALRAKCNLFLMLMLTLSVLSIAITNWCFLADSLPDESVKELCSMARNADFDADLQAMTVVLSLLQVCNVVN